MKMKKQILVSTVASALALCAVSANAATVYSDDTSRLDIIGRMKVNLMNNDANPDRRLEGISRLGVDGKTKVNENVAVYGQVLYELQAQEPQNKDVDRIDIYYGYVGFDFGDFGKLQFGHNEDAFYQVSTVTDVFVDWGTNGSAYWGLTDNDYGGRKDGIAMYELNYNGFLLAASYQFKDASKNVNYAVGATAGYEFQIGEQPLGFRAGYNHYDGFRPHYDGEGPEHDKHQYIGGDKNETALSLYYGESGAPGLYAAFVYNWDKLENTYKVHGLETAVSYTTPGTDWTFTVAYAYLHNADRELSKRSYLGSDDRVFQSAWTGEILYNLTSNFQIYGEAERLNTSVTSPEAQNKLSLGLIYNF